MGTLPVFRYPTGARSLVRPVRSLAACARGRTILADKGCVQKPMMLFCSVRPEAHRCSLRNSDRWLLRANLLSSMLPLYLLALLYDQQTSTPSVKKHKIVTHPPINQFSPQAAR